MTPEERAALVVRGASRATCEDGDALTALVAAAIRAAVDAETEACAALLAADGPGCDLQNNESLCCDAAAKLRQRAASRAKPAP